MKNKKHLSILASLALTASVVTPALADQVSADADAVTVTVEGGKTITANTDGSWSIDVGVILANPGNATPQQSDVYRGGTVNGTVSASTGVTLSKTTWSVSATPDEATYSTKDIVKASGTKPGTYTVIFKSNADENGISRATDSVTITVNPAPSPVVTDTTAPEVAITADRDANENGWYNDDVTLTYSAADAESGITSKTFGSSTFLVSTEGKDQEFTASAINGVGLTSNASIKLSIDKTKPTISGKATTTPNANGWYNSDVTVNFDAQDNLSGVASQTGLVTFTEEGANQFATGTATDTAGNVSDEAKVEGINIDKTKPTIKAKELPKANEFGWYNSDVTVGFEAEDNLSGVDTKTEDTVLTEGANQSVNGTATDKAGNVSDEAIVEGINIDTTNPIINVENGGTYILGQNVEWSAEDLLSGLQTANKGTVDTSKVGLNTQTITATDKAGNTVTKTITYIVKYAFSGVLDPINKDGSSVFKAGSTIPVKFNLKNVSGAFVSTAVSSITYVKTSDKTLGTELEAISTSNATTGNLFRYDSTSNQYIFNFSTKGLTAGTYRFTIKLDDTSSYTVQVSLK